MRRSNSLGIIGAALTSAALALGVGTSDANAQVIERFALHAEGGAGVMVSPWQTGPQLQYNSANIQGTIRFGVSIIDALAIQASVGGWIFFSDLGPGNLIPLTLGLRLEPKIGSVGRLFIDVNPGIGFTGDLQRFHLDAGVGFEFHPIPAFGIGPVARYGFVFQDPGNPFPESAHFLSFGLSLVLRGAKTEPKIEVDNVVKPVRTDQDHDGVPDDEDICPEQPMGEHPDTSSIRKGCPAQDQDNDTIYDSADECPTSPRGAHPDPDRNGCPDGDDDGDLVLNHEDECRTEPSGNSPDLTRPGCPMPDRDGDTIADSLDHCPDQKGAPSTDPNKNGCPGLVEVSGTSIRILQQVFFATKKDRILPRSFPVLQAVADALNLTQNIRRIAIEGHTDDVGDDAANMDLSQRRANSVMAWMLTHNVAASRLEAHGYGETHPLTPIDGLARRALRDARSANRRVEFRIIDPAPRAPASNP